MTQATATVPASQAATLRAWDGRNAAQRLPMKGRTTIQINDMNYRYDLLRISPTPCRSELSKEGCKSTTGQEPLRAHPVRTCPKVLEVRCGWIGHRQYPHAQGENC